MIAVVLTTAPACPEVKTGPTSPTSPTSPASPASSAAYSNPGNSIRLTEEQPPQSNSSSKLSVEEPPHSVAELIARKLVEAQLAGCVNIVPQIRSIYRWQGAVESAEESLLIIKSSTELLPELERELKAIHPYECPEFVVLDPLTISDDYGSWLLANLLREPAK